MALGPGQIPPYITRVHEGGGLPPGGGDMEKRIAKVEADHAVLAERMTSMRDDINRRFDDISKKLDRLPSHWDMAKIVFYVVGALMAAAIWGPRALSLLGKVAQ